jgi:hypothetical protein
MRKIFGLLLTLIIGVYIFYTQAGEQAQDFSITKSSTRNQINSDLNNGDIIFQESLSGQSRAIQLATRSKYSHVGIIYKRSGQLYVYEAVQPVKFTPLQQWINRGKNKHYVVLRLKEAESVLTQATLEKMHSVGSRYKNKNYDWHFAWSDDKMY